MIDTVTGCVVDKEQTSVSLELGGICLLVQCSTKDVVKMDVNSTQKVWISFQIKDEIPVLYGFLDKMERKMFLLLLSVSGVGSKMAMKIIDGISVEQLAKRVRVEDFDGLSKSIKGLGIKLSQKITLGIKKQILDLRIGGIEKKEHSMHEMDLERIHTALSNMGYKEDEIRRVLSKFSPTDLKDSEENLLKKALLELSSFA